MVVTLADRLDIGPGSAHRSPSVLPGVVGGRNLHADRTKGEYRGYGAVVRRSDTNVVGQSAICGGVGDLPVEPLWRDRPSVRLCGAPARLFRSKSVEHLAGVRLHEGVRIGLVHGDVNCGRVEVVEID